MHQQAYKSTVRATCLVLCCTLVLGRLALASQNHHHRRWNPSTYPNPQQDVKLCGRQGVKSSICDPDGILSVETANMVEGLINEIAEGDPPYTKAQCGDQGMQGFAIAVALMHKMEHERYADKAVAAAAFARALHDSWGVGNPVCQNGALLLLAVGDRQVYISTGKGMKDVLPDNQLSIILDNIKPALKHKRYADAILEAVQQLGLLLAGHQPEPSGVDADDGLGIFAFFCATVAAVMGWAWFSNRRHRQRFKKCADKLEAIKRDQAAICARQYAATSCPICLEDFQAPAPTAAAGTIAALRTADGTMASAAAVNDSEDPATPSPSAPLLGLQGGRDRSAAAGPASTSDRSAGANSSSGNVGHLRKGSSSKSSAGRKPLVLRCGHAFCEPCISQWLKSHTNCPICRKDLNDGDEPDEAAVDGQTHPPLSCGDVTAAAGRAPQDIVQQQVWLPELGFRLRRLRMMYPDYVTDPMLYAWEEDLAAGRALDSGVVQQFEARNPEQQQQLEEAGRAGASSHASFGGGSSWGGGGAGSSW